MKAKILTKKTIIKKIYEGLNHENADIMGIGVSMTEIVKPLIEYIEKNTDIEVN